MSDKPQFVAVSPTQLSAEAGHRLAVCLTPPWRERFISKGDRTTRRAPFQAK
jgi:hypothetical protein